MDNNSDSDSEEMLGELSPHQMDLLVQLQDITGIEDLNVCRALLESKNWDLESVAREQLGMGGGGGRHGGPEVSDSDGDDQDSSDQSRNVSPNHQVI